MLGGSVKIITRVRAGVKTMFIKLEVRRECACRKDLIRARL
jgi:hypothetical protein